MTVKTKFSSARHRYIICFMVIWNGGGFFSQHTLEFCKMRYDILSFRLQVSITMSFQLMELSPMRESKFEQELCSLIRDLTLLSSWKYNKVSVFNIAPRNCAKLQKSQFLAQNIRTRSSVAIRMYLRQRAVVDGATVSGTTSQS